MDCEKGWTTWWVVVVLLLAGARELEMVAGSDEDPLQDVCVGDVRTASVGTHPNGFMCKDPSTVEARDFVFSGLRAYNVAPSTSWGPYAIQRSVATAMEFPALNTQGASMVRVEFQAGGVNPPHLHPRASEIAYVAQGTFYSAFVTSDNRVFAQTLQRGDMMLFPRGLVHFQLNVGHDLGVLLGFLNSHNPGTIALPSTLFASHIRDDVLAKAFHMSEEQVHALKAKFLHA